MDELKIYLFGAPRIERNGIEIAPKHRKALALLAHLLLDRRPHARDVLANLLWADYDHSSGLREVRRMLYTLNKILGKGWIVADRQTIAITDDKPIQVDVEAFHLLIDDCIEHGHSSDEVCQRCVQPLERAMTIHTAPFMEGFTLSDAPEFDTWQQIQSAALRRKSEAALEKLAVYYLHQHKLEIALKYARQLLSLDNLRERSYRLLLLLETEANRRTAALHYYEQLQSILAEELAVSPEAQTIALAEQIKQGNAITLSELPHLVEIDRPTAQSNLPSQTIPFIGRKAELASLTELVTSDKWRLISIVGPGGIGKTHLSLMVGESL